MEFLRTIKNTIHGWSEETRKFLAMVTMGIGLLVFFSLWISSVSSRLVAIGPAAPAATAPTAEPLARPTAFLPLRDHSASQDIGASQPSAQISPGSVPDSAPTPVAGIAETFSGLNQLFRTTDASNGLSVRGLWRLIGRMVSATDDVLRAFGGFLYEKASTLIAS